MSDRFCHFSLAYVLGYDHNHHNHGPVIPGQKTYSSQTILIYFPALCLTKTT